MRLYICAPMHATMTERACAVIHKGARAKDSMRHECRTCPGVVALYLRGETQEPRELPERLVSPRNGVAEARREATPGQRVIAANVRRGKAKPSHWPARG